MLAHLAAFSVLAFQPAFSFRTHGPYDPEVPVPEAVLGYPLGSRHSVYMDQDRTIRTIAASAPDRVKIQEYGKSVQGRGLKLVIISSPANMARIEEIRQNQYALARPKPGADDAEKRKDAPAIVWINQCIHGDETASFESAMELIYTLAASRSRETTKMLSDTVVIVNPVYNPDGHERFVVATQSMPQRISEDGHYENSLPSAFFGRSNHYRFDLNRDRVAFSQPETYQEVSAFLKWNPHVYADQHGQVSTYFFPPVQQSVNVNMDRERYNKWTEVFGRAAGRAFDERGWTYYVRDQFDFYNICFLDTYSTLTGAIGMTHETDGGRELASRRADGSILTLRDGMAKHFVSALSVVKAASDNRQALLESYSAFKQKAVTGSHAGKFQRVVLTSRDARELRRLATHLGTAGVEFKWTAEEFRQPKATSFWTGKTEALTVPAGSLIVDMGQTLGPLARALLEPFSDFEPEFVARQKALLASRKAGKRDAELDGFEFYDSTAWALPFAYNLDAWWSPETPSFRLAGPGVPEIKAPPSTVGWAVDYTDQNDILFAARVLGRGVRGAVATREIALGGRKWAPGTFLFLAARNEPGFHRILEEEAKRGEVVLHPLSTSFPDEGRQGPGSDSVVLLRAPKIGIVFGRGGRLAGGALWHLMEREFNLEFVPLADTGVRAQGMDVNCLVFPNGPGSVSLEAIKGFAAQGGCVVSLSDGGMVFGEGGFGRLEARESGGELPGSFFRAELDPSQWLSYGFGGRTSISVPLEGSSFYAAPRSGSAVMLPASPGDRKLLSGWEWEDTEKVLAGAAWLHEARMGGGRAVYFASDPTSRAQFRGLHKLLLNAMILGPSM